MKRPWIGTVQHEYGTNVYVGTTYQAVLLQIAAYCVEYWDVQECVDKWKNVAIPTTTDEIIDLYFDQHEPNEFVGEIKCPRLRPA